MLPNHKLFRFALAAGFGLAGFCGTQAHADLLAKYTFDEKGSGDPSVLLWDTSGNGQHLTVESAKHPVQTAGGPFAPEAEGFYAERTGVESDRLASPGSLDFDADDKPHTVQLWIKPVDTTSDGQNLGFYFRTSNVVVRLGVQQSTVPSGPAAGRPLLNLGYSVRDDNAAFTNNFTAKQMVGPAIQEWVNIAYTYDPSAGTNGEFKFYVDGSLVATEDIKLFSGGNKFFLLEDTDFLGGVDEVGVHDRVLSEHEIQANVSASIVSEPG